MGGHKTIKEEEENIQAKPTGGSGQLHACMKMRREKLPVVPSHVEVLDDQLHNNSLGMRRQKWV